MQITHAEAIQLIHYRADRQSHIPNERMLDEHLKGCPDCLAYARQLNEMENILQGAMRKQWNRSPAPLAIDILTANKNHWKESNSILITRTAMIGIAFLAFVFIGWQFTFTANSNNSLQPGSLPIPTPSTLFTATSSKSQNCTKIQYQIQNDDTLESIADHFSTSKETIMELNNLHTDTAEPNTKILIPVCDSTPTSTTRPPTFTITPFLEPITYTPG